MHGGMEKREFPRCRGVRVDSRSPSACPQFDLRQALLHLLLYFLIYLNVLSTYFSIHIVEQVFVSFRLLARLIRSSPGLKLPPTSNLHVYTPLCLLQDEP